MAPVRIMIITHADMAIGYQGSHSVVYEEQIAFTVRTMCYPYDVRASVGAQ